MTRTQIVMIAIATGLAALLYIWKGEPGLGDQPFADRAAELADRQASELSPEELLTLLQIRAVDFPDDAEPHYYIGVILRETGRPEDADRAFRSALRRQGDHVPSLIALADLLVRNEAGNIRPGVAQLYHRAWSLDPDQVRSGFMAGLAVFRSGDTSSARAQWEEVSNGISPDDPKQGMLIALITAAEAEAAAPPG